MKRYESVNFFIGHPIVKSAGYLPLLSCKHWILIKCTAWAVSRNLTLFFMFYNTNIPGLDHVSSIEMAINYFSTKM